MNYFKASKDVDPSILERLEDPEFRLEFGAELAKSDLAVVLARVRAEAGVSQVELGQRIGASQAYIAKLESGNANPTLSTTGRVFAALGQRLVLSSGLLVPGVEPGPTGVSLAFDMKPGIFMTSASAGPLPGFEHHVPIQTREGRATGVVSTTEPTAVVRLGRGGSAA